MRSSILVLAASLALVGVAAGCDNAADQQAKANAAQADADAKARAAQADADKKIAQAQADFAKLQEDYRHSMTTRLTALDHDIADLGAKDQTLTGKAKADMDASLAAIRASRAHLDTDFNNLQSATASSWDDAKARLEKELSDLKTLVGKAPQRS